eukprot:g20764.t1
MFAHFAVGPRSPKKLSTCRFVAAVFVVSCFSVAFVLSSSSRRLPRQLDESFRPTPPSAPSDGEGDGAGHFSSRLGVGAAVFAALRLAASFAKVTVAAPKRSAMSSMTMMFERFNEKAIKAVMLAQEESRRLKHNFVGVEMLLVGVVEENSSIAAKVMRKMGVQLKEVKKIVEEELGTGEGPVKVEIPFTPEAKQILENCVQEARRREGSFSYKKLVIATSDVPEMLEGKRIVQLDLAMLLAGTKYRGEFEEIEPATASLLSLLSLTQTAERLKNVIKEVLDSERNIILMIDEIHTLVGAGGTGDGGGGGAIDAANIMKPALSRGELQVIGATTNEEYRKYVEKDKALERRFQPVKVPEPTVEETVQILKGLARKYEAHHKLRYSEEALEACVKLASQYVQDRYLPDKAIDVMDETGARVQLRQNADLPQEALEARKELRETEAQKEEAVRAQNYEEAAKCKEEEIKLKKKIRQLAEVEEEEDFQEEIPVVTEADVAQVVSKWTGVPVEKVSSDESVAFSTQVQEILHDRVIGQEEAVTAVAKAVRRARSGLKNPNRPIASFIFCGPTGVGKTELCKALSAAYFGKEDSMIRLDMSEFMERHTVSKLIGSPPGYVGYDEESQLTDGVRRRPYSLVLFDEVEKAHPDVFNLCTEVLCGRPTLASNLSAKVIRNKALSETRPDVDLSQGSRPYCRCPYSLLTCQNIEKGLLGGGGLGFSGLDEDIDTSSYQRLKTVVHDELKNFFRPEFLNRLDEIIVFKFLNEVNSTALQRSSAATPKLLARLDGADTRAFLARCCPEVAQWPAADLAETLRQNLRAAEVVSGFSSEVNRSFFSFSLSEAEDVSHYENLWELWMRNHAELSNYSEPAYPKSMEEARERSAYFLLNSLRVDVGSPLYGDITVVLLPSFAHRVSVISPLDSGSWCGFCHQCFQMPTPSYSHNCSAWSGPEGLGTFQALDHLLGINEAYWATPEAFLHPLGRLLGSATFTGEDLVRYFEVMPAAKIEFPQHVKFVIAAFPSLFGTMRGERVRSWCRRNGWLLVWSLGLNVGFSTDHGMPHFWDVRHKGPFLCKQRLIDPVLLESAQLNATAASEDLTAFAASWRQMSSLRAATLQPEDFSAFWTALVANLSADLQTLRRQVPSTEGENVIVDLDKDEQVLVLRQQDEAEDAVEEVEEKVAEVTAA